GHPPQPLPKVHSRGRCTLAQLAASIVAPRSCGVWPALRRRDRNDARRLLGSLDRREGLDKIILAAGERNQIRGQIDRFLAQHPTPRHHDHYVATLHAYELHVFPAHRYHTRPLSSDRATPARRESRAQENCKTRQPP